MAKAKKEVLNLEPVKKTMVTLTLVGTSDLILNKKARSFERAEIWKQSNPKGEKMPQELDQGYNLWEKLITSIHWRDSIQFHDDDWSKYTEKEWRNYMKNNAPCLHSQAIFGSLYEAFVSFGYKESTGKNGTDIKRGLTLDRPLYPIKFTEAKYVQKLIPNNSKKHTNVLGQYNFFTGWKCDITFYTAEVAFPAKTVIDLIATAGKFCGISTQRKNGFGRYEIDNVQMAEI